MTLAALDAAIKEIVKNETHQALYQEPVLLKFLKNPKGGKVSNIPSITVTSKLNTWGCPACGAFGEFFEVSDYDMVGCGKCKTKFSGIFIEKWDGKPQPKMIGTTPVEIDFPDEDDWDPIVDSSLGAKLLKLKEKVILFREAVINPDRVTTDEQVEQLLKDLFEVSYTLPVGHELEQKINPVPDIETVDLSPDAYDNKDEYVTQLLAAHKAGILSNDQVVDLYKAFGGDDPFPDTPGDDFAFPA